MEKNIMINNMAEMMNLNDEIFEISQKYSVIPIKTSINIALQDINKLKKLENELLI